VSSRLDDAGPLERFFFILVGRHASHDKGLADEMRRGLLKVALADSVRTFISEKSDPDMFGVCIPANILDQTQFENCRIMCIKNGTIGHLEVSRIRYRSNHTRILNHSSSSFSCTILKKDGATLAIFFARAKCSIGEVLTGLVRNLEVVLVIIGHDDSCLVPLIENQADHNLSRAGDFW
jgi:hypothetical protein